MKQEEYETRFYEKQARRTTTVNTQNNTPKTPAGAKPVVDSRDAMEQKKDKLWEKIETTYNPRDAMDRKKDEIWEKIETRAEKEAEGTLYPWRREKNSKMMQPFPFPASIPVLKDVPYPPNGEKASVFYTESFGANFKRQAEYQRKVLESLGYDVELKRTDHVDIFQREWNNMDPKTTTAVVISHCNGMSLIFEEKSKTNAISATGYNKDETIALPSISGLNGPEITALYLYACNAGIEELLAYRGTNVADAFRDLPNVDTVYAFDGSVGFGPPSIFRTTYEPRLSHEQNYDDVFTNFKIPEDYGISGVSGLLKYDSND